MCAIFVYLTKGRQYSIPFNGDSLIHSVKLLAHRGPDGEHIWHDDACFLGFRHLAFFGKNTSLQPLQNEDGSLRLVCNGEIFNFRELQEELPAHRFQSGSDCEVILHLYEKYGQECVQYLKGQFAFVLWDRKRQRVLAARDRFGICPLFFLETKEAWVFASEMKALLPYLPTSPQVDIEGVAEVVCLYGPTPPRTVIRAVSQLPPAHTLLLDRSSRSVRIAPYWQLAFPRRKDFLSKHQKGACKEMLQYHLRRAIKRRLHGRYKLGVYASGGLDSSSLAVLLAEIQQPTSLFSIRFNDPAYDESIYQSALSDFLGLKTDFIHINDQYILQYLVDTIWHAETPLMRTAPVPMYLLSHFVREHHHKTVLSGEGADELLLGYPVFQKRLPSVVAKFNRTQLALSLLLGDRRLFSTIDATLARLTNRTDEDKLQIAQQVEVGTKLSRYLLSTQGDRVAMAHGVEVRYPFLDEDFVAFVCSLPESALLSHGEGKVLLREAMKEKLPPLFTRRAKKGYLAPDAALLRAYRQGDEFLCTLLSPTNIQLTGLYNNKRVSDILSLVRKDSSAQNESVMAAFTFLVSLQIFHELFIRKRTDLLTLPP